MSSASTIYLISTGGTIAGIADNTAQPSQYRAGAVSMQDFMSAHAHYGDYSIQEIPLFSIDSAHMDMDGWRLLAQTILSTAQKPDCSAIIVSHGTDTLEETAFFLSLTVSLPIPVILVAAMRPMNALSSDGPLNFLQALQVATDVHSRGRGILVVLHGTIFSGDRLSKCHTHQIEAFRASVAGPIGFLRDDTVHWLTSSSSWESQNLPLPQRSPRVEIVLSYAGAEPYNEHFLDTLEGLVIAGTGNGTMSLALERLVEQCTAQGKPVVLASRVPDGGVFQEKFKCIPAGFLNPYQARVLLMVILANNEFKMLNIGDFFTFTY